MDVIREVCLRYEAFDRLDDRIQDHVKGRRTFSDPFAEIESLVQTFEMTSKQLDPYFRSKEADSKRYGDAGVPFDWKVLAELKEKTVGLAQVCCVCALREFGAFEEAYAGS